MMKIKPLDVFNIYNKTISFAKKALLKDDYVSCLNYSNTAAIIAADFNWMYCDKELENIFKELSIRILPSYNNKCVKNRVVFYDFRCADNYCLTQQYLRALIDCNFEILYIPENFNSNIASSIIEEICSYPKARILQLEPTLKLIDKIKYIYSSICDFQPEKILLQLAPWSTMAVVIFNAFPNVSRYYINLTDHNFNVGVSCTDYSIEFRNRGCNVALEKRGLSKNQIKYLPYYPITSDVSFEGFPQEITNENIILLSGGSSYKIHGDDNKFYTIIDRLLLENPKLVFVYVGGKNDELFQKYKRESLFNERIFLLDYRKDINQVFNNCDLYINTYPYSGGLMCQLAAVNTKPILAYNTIDRQSDYVEGIVCDSSEFKLTFTDVDALCIEAKKIIDNKEYRVSQGESLKNYVITPEQFSQKLYTLMFNDKSEQEFKHIPINYENIFKRYLDRQNSGSKTFRALFLGKYRFRGLFISPKMFFISLSLIGPFLLHPMQSIKKIKRTLWSS